MRCERCCRWLRRLWAVRQVIQVRAMVSNSAASLSGRLARQRVVCTIAASHAVTGAMMASFFYNRHAVSQTLSLDYIFLVFLAVVRSGSGVQGFYAAFTRGVQLTKVYFGMCLLSVPIVVLMFFPVWLVECRCTDFVQCEALNNFAQSRNDRWLNPWGRPESWPPASATRAPSEAPTPAPTGAHQGNPECWVDGFDFDRCCAEELGVGGDAGCWEGVYSYERCCFPPEAPREHEATARGAVGLQRRLGGGESSDGFLTVIVDECALGVEYEKAENVFDYFTVTGTGIGWRSRWFQDEQPLSCRSIHATASKEEGARFLREMEMLEQQDISTVFLRKSQLVETLWRQMWRCVFTYYCMVLRFQVARVPGGAEGDWEVIGCMVRGQAWPVKEEEGMEVGGDDDPDMRRTLWLQKDPFRAWRVRDQGTREWCIAGILIFQVLLVFCGAVDLLQAWIVFRFLENRCGDSVADESQFDVSDGSDSDGEDAAPASGPSRQRRRSTRRGERPRPAAAPGAEQQSLELAALPPR